VSCGNSLFPVEARDWQGKWLRWDARSYNSHIGRPERAYVIGLHPQIAVAVSDPDNVWELDGGGWDYLRDNLLTDEFTKCRLVVYVEWNGDVGEIRTVFAMRRRFRQDYKRLVHMRGVKI
jgi:hypothetical protein